MNHERFEELRDAYVLGALPEEERREFERYLAAHPERQAEVDELAALASLLALFPHEYEPPPELRDRIMGMVEAESGGVVETRGSYAGGRSWRSRTGHFLDARSLALGAAALLVVGLFSWGLMLRGEVQNLQGRVERLQSQPPEPRMIALGGPGAKQGAQAELVALEGDRAVLVVENMPPVPEDRTLQIWVIEGDVPKPSGLFDPDGDMIATAITSSIEKADAVAVTVEPEGGSPKPTTDPVLVAKV